MQVVGERAMVDREDRLACRRTHRRQASGTGVLRSDGEDATPESLRAYLADDVVYQNTGMPTAAGVDEVLANVAGQFAMFPRFLRVRHRQRRRER